MTDIKLHDATKNLLRLIIRSPDSGDGWRKISPVLLQATKDWAVHNIELFEFEDTPDGLARIRLTERGAIFAEYLA